jgi:hypothetical protein
MNSNVQKLAQYIQQQQQHGRSDSVIKNQLAQGGWSEDVIDVAYQMIWQQSVDRQSATQAASLPPVSAGAPPGNSKKMKRIIIALVILLVVPLIFIVVVVALSGGFLQKKAQETQQQTDAANAQQR